MCPYLPIELCMRLEQSIVGMQAVDNTFRPMICYLSDRGL